MAMDTELLDIGRAQRAFDRLSIPAKRYLYERLELTINNPPVVESDSPIADEMETAQH